jgi:predicted aconitase with swiveling domain
MQKRAAPRLAIVNAACETITAVGCIIAEIPASTRCRSTGWNQSAAGSGQDRHCHTIGGLAEIHKISQSGTLTLSR